MGEKQRLWTLQLIITPEQVDKSIHPRSSVSYLDTRVLKFSLNLSVKHGSLILGNSLKNFYFSYCVFEGLSAQSDDAKP